MPCVSLWTKGSEMSDAKDPTNQENPQNDSIFQKRVQDLILDLAEAESRTHNIRFVDNRIRRKLILRLETYVRRNRRLFGIALKVRNFL